MTVKYGKLYVKDKLGNISEFVPQTQIVPNYTGATSTTAGIPGLVPGALSSERNNFLKADGTWAEVDLSSIISDLNAEISARETAISTLTDRLDDIEELAGAAYHFKGTVTDVNALPVSGNEVGDVWNIGSSLDGDNYAWTGTNWDKLGGTVDLSAYALDADVVHKAGAETITGQKKFTQQVSIENISPRLRFEASDIDIVNAPTGENVNKVWFSYEGKINNNYKLVSGVQDIIRTDGANQIDFFAYRLYNNDGTSNGHSAFGLRAYPDSTKDYAYAPTPAINISDNNAVITKGFLNDLTNDVVHKSGAETITGVKTFNKNWFENVSALTGNQVDVSEASFFTKTITADTTLSFTGVPTGKAAVFTLMLTNGGAYNVTFPNNVVWYSGEQPELQETGTDSLTFFTPDGGTTWYNTDVVVPEIPEVSYSMTNGTEEVNIPTPSNQFDGGIEPIIIEPE